MQILKASLLYFAMVFCVGFLLGVVRTLWVAPRIGERWAEMAETPVMLLFSTISARWVAFHLSVSSAMSARLLMGGFAVALMLLAEFGLVLWVRGISISEYFKTRDPVSGTISYIALGLFAAMPLLVTAH